MEQPATLPLNYNIGQLPEYISALRPLLFDAPCQNNITCGRARPE
jgi:hypothetical protein